MDCIAKGKARVRHEFGTKVSVATTPAGGFAVGLRAMPGNPYDGHTLPDALQQVETLTGSRPTLAVVDRGYRGHGVGGTTGRWCTNRLMDVGRRLSLPFRRCAATPACRAGSSG